MSRLRGRFDRPTGSDMQRFSSSLDVDLRMADEDIDGSSAHARMLGECGILTDAEARQLQDGLEQVREELRSGSWVPDDADEDVHMAVERRLTDKLGAVAKKLHTARSRNDQVATDVRLWIKKALGRLDLALVELIGALVDRAQQDGKVLMPGYTHLQRGQPILFGHHVLAHAWPLSRDRERLHDARRRVDLSPLGACALAGTPHPIDRDRTAALLGFSGVVANAMDAVSARDHIQEVVAVCAICAGGLSRMAEELVLWSSSEFDLVRMGQAYTTGSSIMPQKRNPDAAELVRGKAARVFGDLQTLLALVKALPLAYNRDLQEDRHALFDALDTTIDCVEIMAGVWRSLTVNASRFESALRGDFSLATELADLLVERGVPFREAHEVVGRVVLWCEQQSVDLDGLSFEQAASFHPELGGDLSEWLDPRAAAERRRSSGGTAWPEIERQIGLLRSGLESS